MCRAFFFGMSSDAELSSGQTKKNTTMPTLSLIARGVKVFAPVLTRGAKGSGKATVHTKQFASRKKAREAAQHASYNKTKPVHHPQTSKSGHYHATNKQQQKQNQGAQGGVHFKYGKK